MNGRTNSTNGNQIDIDVTKSPFATLPPTNLTALRGNQKIDLGWTNPVTEMATPGDYVVAKRAYTLVLRNEDHFPTDRSDGVEIYRDTNTEDSSIGAYNDTGLTNGKNYYYGFISVTNNEIPSDVACISMVPSMGVGYSGSLDPLSIVNRDGHSSDTLGSLGAATAGDQQAIFMKMISISESDTDDHYLYINNINAYNSALTKQDIQIGQSFDESMRASRAIDISPVSFSDYAVFGFAESSRYANPTGMAIFDPNLTVLTFYPRFMEACDYRHGTSFNNCACWYSSRRYNITNTQWPRNFEYLTESLTMSTVNYEIHGMNTSGLRTVGEFLCIGPGWYQNVSTSAVGYYSQMNYISKDWTIQSIDEPTIPGLPMSFQDPENDNTSNMLESTGTYVLYANGGTKIETVDTNGTVGMDITNPFATKTSSHWSHGEYVIIFAQGAPGDCVVYDKYLTATYPSDVNQIHTSACATSIQNHAIFGGSNNNNIDVYST